ncbi:MAG: hypothetical protein WCJ55_12620 [Chloroflexales bacterium]
MPILQIDLPPELYARLQDEAQRQGKAAHELAQELLTFQLVPALPEPEQPLYLALAPQIQALVATMKESDMDVPPHGTREDAIRLLQAWNAEDAARADEEEEGDGTWEDVLRSIDANRSSDRKLSFPTWHRRSESLYALMPHRVVSR